MADRNPYADNPSIPFYTVPNPSDTSTTGLMDALRKRLLFRCTHMGMKENDVLFGGFALAELGGLPERDLLDLESLLKENDQDLFLWVTGRKAIPDGLNTPVINRIANFNKA
ncbi:MAG: succinate dehydrogenase assembly factor 2 [Alphaproteobacteria bacterium]|nr:succinate dehydrogenase assembly factor 2 [Alphaproteobacteria bacterium]